MGFFSKDWLRRAARRKAASQSAAAAVVPPLEQREKQPAKETSTVTEPLTPPGRTTEATPDTKCGANKAVAPDAASFEKPTTSPSNTAQTKGRPAEREECYPPSTSTEAQSHALPESRQLWNAAYDSLKEEEGTRELVGSYLKTLMKVLGTDPDVVSDADVSANLNDPTKRQMFMKKLVADGQAKISTSSSITQGVGDVAKFILSAKGMVDVAIRNIPQAALPWAGVCIGLQILLNPAKASSANLAGIAHVVSRMDWYCALTEHLLNKDPVDVTFESILRQLKERIQALYKALLLFQMKSVCSYYQHQPFSFIRGLANLDDWDAYLKTVTDAEGAVLKDWGQYDQCHAHDSREKLAKCAEGMESVIQAIRHDIRDFIALQKGMRRDTEDEECLRDLFVVDPQDDMKKIEKKKDKLLNEAYKWVLDTKEYAALTDWNHDVPGQPSRRLMWIKGPAGTGKTMLLIGIIRELSSHRAKLAPDLSHFFCQGTDAALNSATATLRSLVWLLLVQQPHLISHLRSKHKHAGSSLFKGDTAFIALSDAFKSMLQDPDLFPVYFVLDALDECEHGLPDLVELISDSLTLSSRVKWVVSSRPTVTLSTQETERSMVELDAQKLQDPVNTYINHKLSALETRDGYSDRVLAQIKEEVCRRAENTFLWVALVFKELDPADGKQSPLHGSYALRRIRTIPSGLEKLYEHIMDRIGKGLEDDPHYCKNILVAATLAFRPCTLSELAVLAELPDEMEPRTIVRKCGSLLTVKEETVYLTHQSVKDYLHNNYESRLHPAGMAQGHADISRRSIMAMFAILKQNIYDLSCGFQPKDMRPPPRDPLAPIRYSCVFWADHLIRDGERTECVRELADDGEVFRFLNEKILHWLESLSLLGKLPEAIQSIRKLLRVVQGSSASPNLARLLEDAERFIGSYGSIIERAPLQTYGSALVFSPTKGEVNIAQWKQRLPFIDKVAGIKAHWDSQRSTLEGHSGSVFSVAFSPDGKTLASASHDKTIRLWDAATGSERSTLEGHRDWVRSVAFSPDGKTLASASDDKTIQLWDAATGSERSTLKGHSGSVFSVAFSPDGKTLASASDDKTIRLWDMATGSERLTLEGHSRLVWSVAFSPDSKTLASASHDNTIRLWDTAIGSERSTLEGHSGWVLSIAFSPDGKTLASASDDKTIWLWDAATGSERSTLEGHSDSVRSIAFSPDGKTLASASHDKTIRLWDAATGSERSTLEGHRDWVFSVAFSPDGKTLTSASHDKTIRLWDAATGSERSTLKGHSGWVRSVAFSPDGRYLWTDRGSLQLHVSALPEQCSDESASGQALYVDNEWVTLDGKDSLWLPKDYRASAVAVSHNKIVLGHQSGRVTILGFKFS